MQIQFVVDVNTGAFRYQAGQTYDMPNDQAQRYITQGVAALTAYDAPVVVVSPSAPNNNDGRPDGTVWVQA